MLANDPSATQSIVTMGRGTGPSKTKLALSVISEERNFYLMKVNIPNKVLVRFGRIHSSLPKNIKPNTHGFLQPTVPLHVHKIRCRTVIATMGVT